MTIEIAFITLSDISGDSGHNIATKEMVNAFASRKDLSLRLVAPKPRTNDADRVFDRIDAFYPLPRRETHRILWNAMAQPAIFFRTLQLLNADVIVCRVASGTFLPPRLIERSDARYVVLLRGRSPWGTDSGGLISRISRRTVEQNVCSADQIVVAYDEIRRDLQRLGMSRLDNTIEVVPNGIDPQLFKPEPKAEARSQLNLDIDEDQFVIGFVGSFKKRHRLPELIKALRRCDEARLEIRALLVGDGPLHSEIKTLTDSLGIEHRVEFTGHIPHSKVPTAISACDVLYGAADMNHVSNPIKCYEYLACERPVVTSRTPEFEFIEEINAGILLSEAIDEEISQAILQLQERSSEEISCMGSRGREYVVNHHTWDLVVEACLS